MNDEGRKFDPTLLFLAGAALAVPLIVAFVMIGPDRVWAFLLPIGIAVAVAILAVGLGVGAGIPIRQYRRGEEKPETVREVRDGTRTVEKWYGAPPGRQLAAPQYNQDPFGFPTAQREYLRAAFATGADGQRGYAAPLPPPPAAPGLEADYEDDDADLGRWWDGVPAATDGQNDVPPPAGWNGEIVM